MMLDTPTRRAAWDAAAIAAAIHLADAARLATNPEEVDLIAEATTALDVARFEAALSAATTLAIEARAQAVRSPLVYAVRALATLVALATD